MFSAGLILSKNYKHFSIVLFTSAIFLFGSLFIVETRRLNSAISFFPLLWGSSYMLNSCMQFFFQFRNNNSMRIFSTCRIDSNSLLCAFNWFPPVLLSHYHEKSDLQWTISFRRHSKKLDLKFLGRRKNFSDSFSNFDLVVSLVMSFFKFLQFQASFEVLDFISLWHLYKHV